MPEEIPDLTNVQIHDVSLVDKLTSLQIPSQAEMVDFLTGLHVLQAILMLAIGLACLLQGWKIFKMVVIINAAVAGTLIGSRLGALLAGERMPLFGGVAGAVLFGILAWPLMKYAVSLMGALAGSFLGYGIWHYAANVLDSSQLTQYAWAGALIGLITLGLLAFVIFRLVVEIFTAFEGSLLAVGGIISLLLRYEPITADLRDGLSQNVHLVPLLIGVPAVIGFVFQEAANAKKRKKKSGSGGD